MVDILLATYNGELFIKEQLESLINQTYKDIRIIIRDDGSIDNTINIIESYARKYSSFITVIKDDKKCGSAESNFMEILKYAQSDYAMFCDQDDVWLPEKVELTLNKMIEIESTEGDKPILVFSTYKIVDSDLNPIYMDEKNNQIAAYNLEFNRLLVQNYVTGCLIMMNKKLYKLLGEYEHGIMMHDWWAALVASSLGVIYHIKDITMLYRQHANNVVGAVNIKSTKYRISKLFDKRSRFSHLLYLKQALILKSRYYHTMDCKNKTILDKFISIFNYKNKIKRIIMLLYGRYTKSDFVRVIGQCWFI